MFLHMNAATWKFKKHEIFCLDTTQIQDTDKKSLHKKKLHKKNKIMFREQQQVNG